jgi:uncharacterized protein (DUF1330 family)
MSSFILLQIKVKDPIKLKEYTDPAPATVAPFGGELVFRGNVSGTEWGQSWYSCAVVIRFPDQKSSSGWYASKGYQDLVETRNEAADVIATRYDEPDFF